MDTTRARIIPRMQTKTARCHLREGAIGIIREELKKIFTDWAEPSVSLTQHFHSANP